MTPAHCSPRGWPVPDCPVCAYDNPRSAAVCANCGAELSGTQALATAPVSGGGGPMGAAGWAETIPTAPAVTGPTDVFAPADPTRVPAAFGPAGNGRGTAPPPRDAAESLAPVSRKGADLTVEQTELQVEAGAAVATTLTLHNLGEEVERFRLEVNGP